MRCRFIQFNDLYLHIPPPNEARTSAEGRYIAFLKLWEYKDIIVQCVVGVLLETHELTTAIAEKLLENDNSIKKEWNFEFLMWYDSYHKN